MQARYYDPVIGRFYSNDPVGFTNIHTFNRYGYANNNPYKYVDPDGQSAKVVKALFNIAKHTFKSGGDIRKASKDELLGIVENAAELLDGDWTSDDVYAAVDLSTGFGKEAKNLKKTYFSKKQRKEQYDAADGKCEYCSNDTDFDTPFKPNSAETDHDIPQALGGLTTKANRKNSCRSCNGSGGNGGRLSGKQWKTQLGSRIKKKSE
jgi:uncharacterized protein RhaS with RHS repeats